MKKSDGMFFADLGTNIMMIPDDNMPDDTNIIVKVKGESIEIYINPNRLYNTLRNKDAIVGSLNKKLIELIEDFKTKISMKKVEDSKFRDILIKDVVYDKLKDQDHMYIREAEELIFGITKMMLFKKELEEEKKLKEIQDLEKAQEKIDNDKKEKPKTENITRKPKGRFSSKK